MKYFVLLASCGEMPTWDISPPSRRQQSCGVTLSSSGRRSADETGVAAVDHVRRRQLSTTHAPLLCAVTSAPKPSTTVRVGA